MVEVPHLVRPAEYKRMCATEDCMSVYMLCMCAMYMGNCFVKASSKGDVAEVHSEISFQPHRQRAHTKLRERKETGG